jgi:hypothetical protein
MIELLVEYRRGLDHDERSIVQGDDIMVSERDIANLCRDIYPGGAPASAWDLLEIPAAGVAFGLKDFGNAVAVIFRGSTTIEDWLRDAEAVADPFEHAELGPVHPGFFAGLPELWARLKPRLNNKPCIVAGHSLGAARASLFTGLMIVDKQPPVRRICFGEPRPSFPKAAQIIATVRGRSYFNSNGRGHDVVTDVPFTTFIEDYVHATPLVPVTAPPTDADVLELLIFAWHPMRLYASVTPDVAII